jgi:bifunctional oligoribonuclease and PAP phosphatase NrnA
MDQTTLTKKMIEAGERAKDASKILIVTHVKPDGDCLSSACALSLWLDSIGKPHSLFCADPVSEHYKFLANSSKFNSQAVVDDFDTVFILDCACLSRTGLSDDLVQAKGKQTVIEIDHHPKSDDFSDIEIRLPERSSTAEILYEFFKTNQIEISKDMADCLMTGLITDTGNLLFSSVNEKTIKTSSALLLEGAGMPRAIKNTAHSKGLSTMKIWGEILENARYDQEYGIVYAVLTLEETKSLRDRFGELNSAFDAVSDLLNNVEGAKASLFLREEEPGKIRGSLRSKYPGVDVSKLAAKLGGGGHPKAAAFRFDGHIEKKDGGYRII